MIAEKMLRQGDTYNIVKGVVWKNAEWCNGIRSAGEQIYCQCKIYILFKNRLHNISKIEYLTRQTKVKDLKKSLS